MNPPGPAVLSPSMVNTTFLISAIDSRGSNSAFYSLEMILGITSKMLSDPKQDSAENKDLKNSIASAEIWTSSVNHSLLLPLMWCMIALDLLSATTAWKNFVFYLHPGAIWFLPFASKMLPPCSVSFGWQLELLAGLTNAIVMGQNQNLTLLPLLPSLPTSFPA